MVFAFAGDSTTTSDFAIWYFHPSTVAPSGRIARPPPGPPAPAFPGRTVAAATAPARGPIARKSRPNRTVRRAAGTPAPGRPVLWTPQSPRSGPIGPTAARRATVRALPRYRPQT